jgi:hypothetical protein
MLHGVGELVGYLNLIQRSQQYVAISTDVARHHIYKTYAFRSLGHKLLYKKAVFHLCLINYYIKNTKEGKMLLPPETILSINLSFFRCICKIAKSDY